MIAAHVDVEDSGHAKIFEAGTFTTDSDVKPSEDGGMFVRIQSWSDESNHTDFDQFIGKRIRVTIETLD